MAQIIMVFYYSKVSFQRVVNSWDVGQFGPWTIRTSIRTFLPVNSDLGRFGPRSIRTLDDSDLGQFGPFDFGQFEPQPVVNSDLIL